MANYLNQIFSIKSDIQQLLIMVSNAKRQIKWLDAFEASPEDRAARQRGEQLEKLFISLQYIQEMIESVEQTRVKLKVMESNLMRDEADVAAAAASNDLDAATKRTCEKVKKKRVVFKTLPKEESKTDMVSSPSPSPRRMTTKIVAPTSTSPPPPPVASDGQLGTVYENVHLD